MGDALYLHIAHTLFLATWRSWSRELKNRFSREVYSLTLWLIEPVVQILIPRSVSRIVVSSLFFFPLEEFSSECYLNTALVADQNVARFLKRYD